MNVPCGGQNSIADEISRYDICNAVTVRAHASHETHANGGHNTGWTVIVVDPSGHRFIYSGNNCGQKFET